MQKQINSHLKININKVEPNFILLIRKKLQYIKYVYIKCKVTAGHDGPTLQSQNSGMIRQEEHKFQPSLGDLGTLRYYLKIKICKKNLGCSSLQNPGLNPQYLERKKNDIINLLRKKKALLEI